MDPGCLRPGSAEILWSCRPGSLPSPRWQSSRLIPIAKPLPADRLVSGSLEHRTICRTRLVPTSAQRMEAERRGSAFSSDALSTTVSQELGMGLPAAIESVEYLKIRHQLCNRASGQGPTPRQIRRCCRTRCLTSYPHNCHNIPLLCTIATLNKGENIGAFTGTSVPLTRVSRWKLCP